LLGEFLFWDFLPRLEIPTDNGMVDGAHHLVSQRRLLDSVQPPIHNLPVSTRG
jgi:hypothetical protein